MGVRVDLEEESPPPPLTVSTFSRFGIFVHNRFFFPPGLASGIEIVLKIILLSPALFSVTISD